MHSRWIRLILTVIFALIAAFFLALMITLLPHPLAEDWATSLYIYFIFLPAGFLAAALSFLFYHSSRRWARLGLLAFFAALGIISLFPLLYVAKQFFFPTPGLRISGGGYYSLIVFLISAVFSLGLLSYRD